MAGMVKADYLFLLTDVDCLYTDNPRTNPDAKPVAVCEDMVQLREQGTHITFSFVFKLTEYTS